MTIRGYKWTVAILLIIVALLGWQLVSLRGQLIVASFIGAHCEDTQTLVVEGESDPQVLAHDVEFLMGYYEGYGRGLKEPHLKRIVRRDYQLTLTNAVSAFRRWTTNDLGGDPKVWIEKYGR